ncbi:MAG: transporter ATP-binding protein [Herbinix sp.]|jgi:putative ABC transport system ATP-binding protein|nr:transporter ATP-binding protein [Herbinix sp.]
MIEVQELHYSYPSKYQIVEALCGVNCIFESGKLYTVIGKSGSGKSTLLSLLSGLDVPTKGSIIAEGENLLDLNRDQYRRNKIAVIYQNLNLFPLLTVLENIMYPMRMNNIPQKEALEKARSLLKKVDLSETYENKLPSMLSGGEQQRVAIARALGMPGKIILADEPTGNLDTTNTENIVQILLNLAHELNYCVIIVTHDFEIAKKSDRFYELKNGSVIFSGTPQEYLFHRMV